MNRVNVKELFVDASKIWLNQKWNTTFLRLSNLLINYHGKLMLKHCINLMTNCCCYSLTLFWYSRQKSLEMTPYEPRCSKTYRYENYTDNIFYRIVRFNEGFWTTATTLVCSQTSRYLPRLRRTRTKYKTNANAPYSTPSSLLWKNELWTYWSI